MSYDGFMVHGIVWELNKKFQNAQVQKIYQVARADILFILRLQKEQYRLLISANSNEPRIYLTSASFARPTTPPLFCTILRKHLTKARITAIRQIKFDRIIELDFVACNNLGDQEKLTLIIELMGRCSNIILIAKDSKIIYESIKHVSKTMSRHRQILPGLKYILPPAQNKFDPSLITQEEFLKLLSEKNSHKILQGTIQGLGPLLTKEIVFEQEEPLQIWQSFKRQIARLEAKDFSPVIMAHEGKKFAYLWTLQHLGTSINSYPDLSSCLDNYYLNKNAVTLVDELKAPLLKVVHKALQKNQHKVQKLEQELIIAEEYDRNRHFGELLMASLSEIKKGQTTCSLYSYETKQVEKIKLEAKHSPLDNAKRYFKNYKKQKERIRWNKEQIAKTKAANNYLETLATQLEISTKETLAEIKEELVEYGLVSRKRRPKEQQSELKPARYYATDQTLIMVGHSNKQNEMLTHKIAHKTDIWLHVKEIPGAHVVLRAKNATTPAALHEAALLAMHFSRARCSSQVPVDYTLVKYVKKIPGANIGLVTYTNQKTIFINNNEQLLNRLLKTQSN